MEKEEDLNYKPIININDNKLLKQKQKDDEAVEIGKGDIEAVEEVDSDSDSTSTVSSTTESIFPHSASSISYILQPVLIYLQSHPSSTISLSSSFYFCCIFNFLIFILIFLFILFLFFFNFLF